MFHADSSFETSFDLNHRCVDEADCTLSVDLGEYISASSYPTCAFGLACNGFVDWMSLQFILWRPRAFMRSAQVMGVSELRRGKCALSSEQNS